MSSGLVRYEEEALLASRYDRSVPRGAQWGAASDRSTSRTEHQPLFSSPPPRNSFLPFSHTPFPPSTGSLGERSSTCPRAAPGRSFQCVVTRFRGATAETTYYTVVIVRRSFAVSPRVGFQC
ncbi:hypothetical protein MRX96_017757 [Rhipicephalus microplus]